MYLRIDVVERAIEELSKFHPFFGITFLVCKQFHLPVGQEIHFPIASAEEAFLKQYYHPDPQSSFFFQPFRSSGEGRWLSAKYPSSGSQSTRTRGQLATALLHTRRRSDLWGWAPNYVEALAEKLRQDGTGSVPAFWLAVWLFRDTNWPEKMTARAVTELLIREFSLTEAELTLFDTYTPERLSIFTPEPLDESALLRRYPPAPDSLPEEGGILSSLTLKNVGPAQALTFDPGRRLTVVTGDNGLGKTFLLECAWWSLTGHWAEREALPFDKGQLSEIRFSIVSKRGTSRTRTVFYDSQRLRWPVVPERLALAGLVIYARVDGSFAIWDPARLADDRSAEDHSGLLVFDRDQVLNGRESKIEGLIRDWVRWQTSRDQSVFEMFESVLGRLSPPDMNPLTSGEPTRVPGDVRDIPTLLHEYGIVPVTNESAGVKRIVTIAYLLVWAWNEHKLNSTFKNKEPQANVVLMIDEVEAHLHPKWQRSILPALLDVTKGLSAHVNPQVVVASHSPLVLASIEDSFSDVDDRLFHLYLNDQKAVTLDSVDFVKRGTVDEWLTSTVFELRQPRSREGEKALEDAKRILADSSDDLEQIRKVDDLLRVTLPSEDRFWPRWLHFVQAKGAA